MKKFLFWFVTLTLTFGQLAPQLALAQSHHKQHQQQQHKSTHPTGHKGTAKGKTTKHKKGIHPASIGTSFVTVDANGNLKLDGVREYAAGTNAHWLGTVSSGTDYPTDAQVTALFAGVNDLVTGTDRIPVVRSFTLAAGIGCAACIWTAYNASTHTPTVNATALAHFLSVLNAARSAGVRLVITFADNTVGSAEPGNIQNWVNTVDGDTTHNKYDFYRTDLGVITGFEDYITWMMQQTTTTSYHLGSDPVVFAFEAVNEAGAGHDWNTTGVEGGTTNTYKAWEQVIDPYMTQYTTHLILTSHEVSDSITEGYTTNQAGSGFFDIMQTHQGQCDASDPARTSAFVQNPIGSKSKSNNKASGAGEFTWMGGTSCGESLSTWISAVDKNCTDLALLWEGTVTGRSISNSINLQTHGDASDGSDVAWTTIHNEWATSFSSATNTC